VPVLFCVFGGEIHEKFMKMDFCCFCWGFGIGIGFFLLSFFVEFLIRGIFVKFITIFFWSRTINDSINVDGVQLYGSWDMIGKLNYVA
jgi:hypothetical protein